MANVPSLVLNDGNRIPQLGLGMWQTPPEQVAGAVAAALEAGYRAIDTAHIYANERDIGAALKTVSLPRGELFITSKVWNSDQGYAETLRAAETSLGDLGLDYLDLYLIHWPLPARGKFVDTWRALVKLREQGKVRSIGVSNFNPDHIEKLVAETGVVPAVNQIELHPFLQQGPARDFHQRHGIATESWSPLAQGGELLQDPRIAQIAAKHGKTPAQVIIRWHLDAGLIVIPKSVTPSRIRENLTVFDFTLDADDTGAIAALDAGKRLGPDPATFDWLG